MSASTDQLSFQKRIQTFLKSGGLSRSITVKILLAAALVFLITLMFPHAESIDYSFHVGGVWADKDLVAPFAFPILKELRRYEKERVEAAKGVMPVFRKQGGINEAQEESLLTILNRIRFVIDRRNKLKPALRADSTAALASRAGITLQFSEREWQILSELQPEKGKPKSTGSVDIAGLSRLLSGSFSEVLRTGIINQHKSRQTLGAIALREGSLETIIPTERLYDYDSAIGVLENTLDRAIADDELREVTTRIIRAILVPNILYDEGETSRSAQAAEENVPRTVGFVQQNEVIIGKNQLITEDARLKLESYQHARRDRGIESEEWRHWTGIVLHVMLILGLFTLYLHLFRKKIFRDNGKLFIIALLILFEAFLTYLSVKLPIADPVQYLICIAVASMLLAIIFDSRVAFYGTVTIALLIAAMRGNDYSIGLVSLVAGAFGAYTVRDISHRTQIFRSIVFIFLGYAVAILALSVEQFDSLNSIGAALTFAFANAVLSPVLTYALLLFFEKAFNVTTDLTLVELADLNHPLLQELSERAPGTFHHSVTIGNLAEAGAEAIGANAILAKVGGYYHDIGKMVKPEYFVENQVGGHNRHNRLRPRMSALIISSHVREGVELGRERKLPEQIIEFIPQHHGTNRISYFYDKALRQAIKRPSKETINEEDFRYPGPKPQSKETGIVMLADSVEASTRALTELTPHSLARAIDNMIKHRFLEGQLDECELTLRDLSNIREAFLQMLIGIHHQRIKYPDQLAEEAAVEQESVSAPPPVSAALEKSQPFSITEIRPPQVALSKAPSALSKAPPAPSNAPVEPTNAPVAPTNAPVAPTNAPVARSNGSESEIVAPDETGGEANNPA